MNPVPLPPTVLGIETSCDETAAAVVRGTHILSNIVSSQTELHRKFGGVVPEIAGRAHQERLPKVLETALHESGVSTPDAVAVTTGPGLIGAVLTGVSFAQGLAGGWRIPLIPVNHLHAHLWGTAAVNGVAPPFGGLVISGGHTAFYLWRAGSVRPEFLGGTVDDAAGEAFDKVSALLSLGYPGGPAIEKAAARGTPSIPFPLGGAGMEGLRLSFSGLKTAVMYHVRKLGGHLSEREKADIAASFQKSVAETLARKTAEMVDTHGIRKMVVGGGVAANKTVREHLRRTCLAKGVEIRFPPPALSQDNAAMVALLGATLIEKTRLRHTAHRLIPEPYPRGKERPRKPRLHTLHRNDKRSRP